MRVSFQRDHFTWYDTELVIVISLLLLKILVTVQSIVNSLLLIS